MFWYLDPWGVWVCTSSTPMHATIPRLTAKRQFWVQRAAELRVEVSRSFPSDAPVVAAIARRSSSVCLCAYVLLG